jgi:hypothetical protein
LLDRLLVGFKSLIEDLSHYGLVCRSVFQTASPADRSDALPVRLIVQKSHALPCAFFWTAPKDGLFILSIELYVLRGALRTQNAPEIGYLEGTLGRQIAISLGKQP